VHLVEDRYGVMGLAIPDEQTTVERILELALQVALWPLPAILSFNNDVANVGQRMLARGVEFINLRNATPGLASVYG
jgi:hypothetical protein